MRIPRIFQACPLSVGQTIILDATAAHHAIHVLRLKKDDLLTLFNGKGGEYSGKIASLSKREVSVTLQTFHEHEVESPLIIHLGQGISRGERMDFVIQKAVELGVMEITPLLTKRCTVKLSDERWAKRMTHWKAIMINACEQSGRNRIPILHSPCELQTWLNKKDQSNASFVLSHHATQNLRDIKIHPEKVRLLIGPEGGLNEQEITKACEHKFQTIALGKRILRTETATLAAMTILQSRWGDMRG